MGRRRARAAAARGRLHAVPEPRLGRRRASARTGGSTPRPATGASFDTQDFGQAGNPCGDPANEGGSLRSPGRPDGSRPARSRWRGVADRPRDRRPPRTAAPATRTGWCSTASATPGASPSGRAPPSCGPPTSAAARGRRSTAPTWRRSPGRPTSAGPATRARSAERSGSPAWDALDKPICEGLYAQGAGSIKAPSFAYETRGPLLTPGEHCQSTHVVDLRHRVRAGSQQLPGGLPGLAVLLRLRPRLRLAPGQEAERRPGPGQHHAVRPERVDARPARPRPRRRPVLRRLRHRGRPGDPAGRRDPPDHLPGPGAAGRHHGRRQRRTAQEDGTGSRPGRDHGSPRARADLHLGPRRQRHASRPAPAPGPRRGARTPRRGTSPSPSARPTRSAAPTPPP